MDKVEKLIIYHDWGFPAEKKNVRRALNKISDELFPCFIEVKKADTAAQSNYRRDEKYEWIDRLNELYEEIKSDGECFSLKDLAVNGRDLIEKGITPGKELGDILSAMLSDVLDDPSHNTKDYLLNETNFAKFSMKGNE